jgi:hypothetical protein
MTHHGPVTGTAPASITELLQLFGDRWTIAYEPTLNIWSAEGRSTDGRHIRFLSGHSVTALAAKLADVETAES